MKRNTLLDILLAVCLFPLFAMEINGQESALRPTGYPDLDLYYSQLNKNSGDALEERRNYLLATLSVDSLMNAYIFRGIDAMRDTVSLSYYFNTNPVWTHEARRALFPEAYKKAAGYKNKALMRLMDFLQIRLLDYYIVPYEDILKQYEQLLTECQRVGDDNLAAYILKEMWREHYHGARSYARTFAYGLRLEEALGKISDSYPYKVSDYLLLGTSYYRFKDYDRALALFHKGLSLRNERDFLLSLNDVLLAWNHLAIYYEREAKPDSAIYYQRTILGSTEALACEPVHLDIAICNLGRIKMAEGDYDTAIAYLQAALPHLRLVPASLRWDFAHGVYISLGECMLAKHDLPAVAHYIEMARDSLEAFPEMTQAYRMKDIFALEANYYSRRGEFDKAAACIDSVKIYTERYESLTAQNHITLGEQQLQEAEAELDKQQIAGQRRALFLMGLILGIAFAALFTILQLYRKKHKAYQALAQKALQ